MSVRRKADLVIHPIRLQIMQALAGESLTTQEISDALPAVPKSSIYRHLGLLLEGKMIEVAEVRPVRGIQEKVYRLVQAPHLGPEEVAGFIREDHLRYFSVYVATLLRGFADYVASDSELDLVADRAGYTEVIVHATRAELDKFAAALNQAVLEMLENRPGDGCHRHKIAFVTHPVNAFGDDDG